MYQNRLRSFRQAHGTLAKLCAPEYPDFLGDEEANVLFRDRLHHRLVCGIGSNIAASSNRGGAE